MKPPLAQITSFIFALSIWLFFAKPALAQIPNQIPVGSRPLSMGEAFVAVADDGNAIYWNPAGLARLERIEFSFSHANLLGLGVNSYYLSLLSRLSFIPWLSSRIEDYCTVGVDWSKIGTDDKDAALEYRRDQINLAVALQPPNRFAFLRGLNVGANLKLVQFTASLDERPEAEARGFGFDFGLLYDLHDFPIVPKGLNFGVMVHDAGNTTVKHETGRREEANHETIRWGLSYRPFEDRQLLGKLSLANPVLAFDVDDRIHLGLECWLKGSFGIDLALRAGWQKDRHTKESAIFSFGTGFKIDPQELPNNQNENEETKILLDLPSYDSRVISNTQEWGGSFIIRDNPRLIRIEAARINREVFASLYPFYGKRESKLGEITLKNVHSEKIPVTISFHVGDYTLPGDDTTIVIDPGTSITPAITARFKPEILKENKKWLSGEMRAAYNYKKTPYQDSKLVTFRFYEKNEIIWDDPAKAAAFVTSTDPAVVRFCEQVVRAQPSDTLLVNSKISRALKLFEGLAAYGGFLYKPDPNLPIALRGDIPDKVQYPSELLRSRQGDCDDFAVLYAALLENIGISTALLSTPDHLFMMFDTGMPVNQQYRLGVDRDLLVFEKGNIWLPIETTWIDSSFSRAWQEGAIRYQIAGLKKSEFGVFPVQAGWTKYPPTSPKYAFPPPFPLVDLNRKIERSLVQIETLQQEFLNKNYLAVLKRDPNDLRTRNELGVFYAQNDLIEKAQKEFEAIYRRDRNYAPALNNLANLYFIQAKYDEAERYYQMALREDPAGTYLNLTIFYYWRMFAEPQDSAEFDEKSLKALDRAAQILNYDLDRALALLGLPEEEYSDKVEGPNDWRQLLKHTWKRFQAGFKPKKNPKDRVPQAAAPRGAGEPDKDRAVILWWSKAD